MGQRYSSAAGCALGDRLATLHCAIAEGESDVALKLANVARRCGGNGQDQLYLSYRGETSFGIEIRYSQTALALAIQFRQWGTFRSLLHCGLSAGARQRMLVPGSSGRSCTRDFASALELFVWALTQATYFPPYLSECEVLDLLRVTIRHGADPDHLPPQLLRQVGQSALMDIMGADFLDVDTTTVLQRSALSVLKCLVQQGMSPMQLACLASSQLSLYHLALCFLTDAASGRQLLANQKLRQAACLLLNAFHGGVQPPAVTATSLGNSKSRNTALFWYYYSKIKQRSRVGQEDVAAVLRSHGRIVTACRQPPRLAILARNGARAAVAAAAGAGSFAARVGQLKISRQLRQRLQFMDEEALRPEIDRIVPRS